MEKQKKSLDANLVVSSTDTIEPWALLALFCLKLISSLAGTVLLMWVFCLAFSVQHMLSGDELVISVCQRHSSIPILFLNYTATSLHVSRVSNSSLQYVGKYLHLFPSHLVEDSSLVQYKVLCLEEEKNHCLALQFGFEGALCLFNKGQTRHGMRFAAKSCFHPVSRLGWWIYEEVMDFKVMQWVSGKAEPQVLLTPVLCFIVRPYSFVFTNDCSKWTKLTPHYPLPRS